MDNWSPIMLYSVIHVGLRDGPLDLKMDCAMILLTNVLHHVGSTERVKYADRNLKILFAIQQIICSSCKVFKQVKVKEGFTVIPIYINLSVSIDFIFQSSKEEWILFSDFIYIITMSNSTLCGAN